MSTPKKTPLELGKREMLPQSDRFLESFKTIIPATDLDQRRLEQLRTLDVEATRRTANQLLARLSSKYADVVDEQTKANHEQHSKALSFAISKVRAGQPVPELNANDVSGIPFRFSDHRDQVVVVTFCYDNNNPAVQKQNRLVARSLGDAPVHFVTVVASDLKADTRHICGKQRRYNHS